MSDMFAGYAARQARTGTWDEMFTAEGDTRPACVNLLDGLRPLVDAELGARATALTRLGRLAEARPLTSNTVPLPPISTALASSATGAVSFRGSRIVILVPLPSSLSISRLAL